MNISVFDIDIIARKKADRSWLLNLPNMNNPSDDEKKEKNKKYFPLILENLPYF